jgi:DnaJ-class molecular chaperone
MRKDYYALLGVNKNSTQNEIKKAYRHKALEFHPDKNINNDNYDPQMFREVSDAYQILGNESNKKKYDTLINMNGVQFISEADFMKIFGQFQSPANIFNDVFENIPIQYQEISNNIFNYFFEDKTNFEESLNNFEFNKIATQFKTKLFNFPKHLFRNEESYYTIFYKVIKIVYSIFYFCAFHFLNKLKSSVSSAVL